MDREQPRETVPIVKAEEEFENEERGGFEDYTEQLVLSPTTVEEIAAPPIRNESRGNRKATCEERSNHELLVLLKYMRDGMRSRHEQLKEGLRWREKHFEKELKKKYDNLIAALKQRDSEWIEELAEIDRALRIQLKEREKAFITEQLKRGQELLKILEVREKEME